MSQPRRSSLIHIDTSHDGFFAETARAFSTELVTRNGAPCEAVTSVAQPTPRFIFLLELPLGGLSRDRRPRCRSRGPLVDRPWDCGASSWNKYLSGSCQLPGSLRLSFPICTMGFLRHSFPQPLAVGTSDAVTRCAGSSARVSVPRSGQRTDGRRTDRGQRGNPHH